MFSKAILLTLLISATKAHTPVNSSDIIIVGGHADIQDTLFLTTRRSRPRVTIMSDSDDEFKASADYHETTIDEYLEKNEDVLFVPTDRSFIKNDDTMHEDTIRMSDVLENNKRISSLVKETEAPGDILFIQGKNNERQSINDNRRRNNDNDDEFRYINDDDDDDKTTTKTTPIPLDCTNLDCENTLNSICGSKKERSENKYRLFKNECFFRKVNCGFNYEMNRYVQVNMEFCKHVGMHVTKRPYDYEIYFPEPRYRPRSEYKEEKERKNEPSRRFEGRRAMAMNFGGSFCAHDCPNVCTEAYEPECALSSTGERRTFNNHCQLDLISCQTNTMWRRRPLAECTGGKKADLHQNRAFIDWMQRVGIVDRKGKLVLNGN